jgi:hypothetical protein
VLHFASELRPLAIECQMPPYETAVASMIVAQFSGASIACAGTANSIGYGRVWTGSYATNSWQPTIIWNNATGVAVQVRSLFSYTDSVTEVAYLFAGSHDTNQKGGIFHATYNAKFPVIWCGIRRQSLQSLRLIGA